MLYPQWRQNMPFVIHSKNAIILHPISQGDRQLGATHALLPWGWSSCSPRPYLTVILRATPSSCVTSSRILWAILKGGPPSDRGRDRWAKTLLPETKWSCTAAVSFLRARRPCHTMGYFCQEETNRK